MLLLKGENRRQSLILRTCSLLLAIIMVVSIAVPPVQAEDAGKKDTAGNQPVIEDGVISNSTKNIAPQNIDPESTLGQLIAKTGVEFSEESIKKAGVTDERFAKAIYDSIIKDSSNFRKNIRIDEEDLITDEGEDLSADEIIEKGKEEGLDFSTEGLTAEEHDKIAVWLILSYFTGTIKANDKEIESIDGIKILRRAFAVDLRDNNIKSMIPLEKGKGYITEPDDARTYFGEERRNIIIRLVRNPIVEYPSELDGRISLGAMAKALICYPDINLQFLVSGDEQEGVSTGNIPIDIKRNSSKVKVDDLGIRFFEPSEVEIENKYANSVLGDLRLKGIHKNENVRIAFGVHDDSRITIGTTAVTGDVVTTQATTFKWEIPINIALYTSISETSTTQGGFAIKKIAKKESPDAKEKPLAGAEFTIFKQEDDSKVTSGTTGEDGEIRFTDLDPGKYYAKETKAPEGYILDSTEHKFEIKEGSIEVLNTRKNSEGILETVSSTKGDKIEVFDGSDSHTETIKNGVFVEGGGENNLDLKIHETENSVLDTLTVKWTAGTLEDGKEGEIGYIVDAEKSAQKAKAGKGKSYRTTIEEVREAALAKIKEAAEKHQNVTVTASFKAKENIESLVLENEPKLGSLKLAKSLEPGDGNDLMDPDKEFEFEIKITDSEGKEFEGYYFKDGNTHPFQSGNVIKLKNTESIQIDKIPEKSTFTITELNTGGYIVSGSVNENPVEENSFNGEIAYNKTTAVEVINQEKTYRLSVYKENDDESPEPLEGAVFTLYREATEQDEPDKIQEICPDPEKPDDKVKVVVHQSGVTKCGGYKASTEFSIDEIEEILNNPPADPDRQEKAFTTFSNLKANTQWYLSETYVPDGYQLMQRILTVCVDKDGAIAIKGMQEVGGELIEGYLPVRPLGGNEFAITLTNKLNLIIPKAGRGGVYWYTIIGTLLIAAAAVTGAMAYRKKRIY